MDDKNPNPKDRIREEPMMTDHTPEHSKTHQTTITGNENGWTATCTCGFHSTQTSRRATAMNAAADHKEAQR